MLKKPFRRKFSLFGFNAIIEIAPKKTLWFEEVKEKRGKPRQRRDSIVGVGRFFLREAGVYVYEVVFFRFRALIADDRRSTQNKKLQDFLLKLDKE